MDQVTGYCAGCLRTLDEIATWGMLDDAEKHEVWLRLEARRLGLTNAVGGSRG